MSIKIRLAKIGKKNAPTYKVVVAQTRTKRNGEFLDILGNFNPAAVGKPAIDKVKLDDWLKRGALLTEPVRKIVEGTYHFIKYNPKAEKKVASSHNPDRDDGVERVPQRFEEVASGEAGTRDENAVEPATTEEK